MSFTAEEIREFEAEANDLIEAAEKSLLSLDKGEAFVNHYDAIFRALHSIKGAAGMMDMHSLQNHMHQLETIFTHQKNREHLDKPLIDMFLKGLDATKTLLGGGTIDFKYLSIETPKPAAVMPEEKRNVLTNPKLVTGKILVVDDEPEIVELITQILRQEHIEVKGLTSAENILAEVNEFKPDAIFSDITMPGMTGLDLLALVSNAHPYLPVAFISGYVSKDILLDAIRLGVFAVIEKPFDVVRVAECGHNAIQKNKLVKMITSSINLLMYQFSDLSEYLKSQGKEDIHKIISDEIASLLEQKRALRRKPAASSTLIK